MSKKEIERMIPLTFKAIETCIIKKEGHIDKVYKGYIESFGPTVIQSGLLPAICLYEKKGTSSEGDKKCIIKAIQYILQDYFEEKNDTKADSKGGFLELVEKKPDKAECKEKIMNAVIALKLAIRTFEFDDQEKRGTADV